MSVYMTLGADENGEVYGLELNEDGSWRRNPLGYATSCVVIRPVSKETYEYVTKDPESAKDLWQSCVAADKTELGLEEWFEEYVSNDDVLDTSFVYDLLDDEDNPTVAKWCDNRVADGDHEFESFKQYVKAELVESPKVTSVKSEDDIYEWESSGWFAPDKPFVVEFAPHDLIEEYYAHLEKCNGLCDFKRNKESGNETTNAN